MVCGEKDVDIKLTIDGQPAINAYGDFATVSDTDCWMQDIKSEALVEQQEVFYEDVIGKDSYGWGLLEFLQQEYNEFTEAEIKQRIREKLGKRSYIDHSTIKIDVVFLEREFKIHISFQRQDENKEYNIDLRTDGVEVILE